MRNKIYIAGHIVEAIDGETGVVVHVNPKALVDGTIWLTQRHILEIQKLLNPDFFEEMMNIVRRKSER